MEENVGLTLIFRKRQFKEETRKEEVSAGGGRRCRRLRGGVRGEGQVESFFNLHGWYLSMMKVASSRTVLENWLQSNCPGESTFIRLMFKVP